MNRAVETAGLPLQRKTLHAAPTAGRLQIESALEKWQKY
jgi:hypothetical protein